MLSLLQLVDVPCAERLRRDVYLTCGQEIQNRETLSVFYSLALMPTEVAQTFAALGALNYLSPGWYSWNRHRIDFLVVGILFLANFSAFRRLIEKP